jgi:hypothetical protein
MKKLAFAVATTPLPGAGVVVVAHSEQGTLAAAL